MARNSDRKLIQWALLHRTAQWETRLKIPCELQAILENTFYLSQDEGRGSLSVLASHHLGIFTKVETSGFFLLGHMGSDVQKEPPKRAEGKWLEPFWIVCMGRGGWQSTGQ